MQPSMQPRFTPSVTLAVLPCATGPKDATSCFCRSAQNTARLTWPVCPIRSSPSAILDQAAAVHFSHAGGAKVQAGSAFADWTKSHPQHMNRLLEAREVLRGASRPVTDSCSAGRNDWSVAGVALWQVSEYSAASCRRLADFHDAAASCSDLDKRHSHCLRISDLGARTSWKCSCRVTFQLPKLNCCRLGALQRLASWRDTDTDAVDLRYRLLHARGPHAHLHPVVASGALTHHPAQA